MVPPDSSILVSSSDIADMAGVSPSAVSNWKKRHEDFPNPRLRSDAGDLFSFDEVQRWLLENSKIDGPIAPRKILWNIANTFRDVWDPDQLWSFIVAALVYLVASKRAERGDAIEVANDDRWDALRDTDERELPGRMAEAASRIEAANPQLENLLVPGLTQRPFPPPDNVTRLIRSLHASLQEEDATEVELFHELSEGLHVSSRFQQEYATPDSLAMLAVRLVEPVGPRVVDPAVGNGGLLLMAATAGEHAHGELDIVGVDINDNVLRYARAWFFIYRIHADLRRANSLHMSPESLGPAETLLLDPPYGLGKWADADLYLDERWKYGAPPAHSADFAWLQIAAMALSEDGRAAVIQPAGSSTRGGREAEIRQALVEDGCVEAVIHLPDRLRLNTAIPLSIWLLRGNRTAADQRDVLLVDANDLGISGRRTNELDEAAIDRIAAIVDAHRRGRPLPEEDLSRALTVPTDELRDAILLPDYYRDPAEHVDVDELQATVRDLRASIAHKLWETRHALDVLEDHISGESS